MGQYPLVKRRIERTVVNQCLDGSQIKLADSQAAKIQWELTLAGLTDAEWQAIAALFSATEGRLQNFVFMDPTDNLLVSSADLSATAWSKDAGLQVTYQVGDPLGGTSATTLANTSQATQGVQQSIEIPAGLEYCFSVFAQSPAAAQVTLFQATQTTRAAQTFNIGPGWGRLVFAARLNDTTDPVTFGLQMSPGTQATVFGFQVETQPGASPYKSTTSGCGVYPSARFMDDSLSTTTTDAGQHSCTIRIETHPEDQG
jgi:hypothetical protein